MSDASEPRDALPGAPCYLDVGAPMLCTLTPAPGTPRDVAVLLCPPFGWDEMCSYRPRRAWAQDLAARGYPTLRIDLPGTGSSGGGPERPGLVPAWVEGVSTAAAWLRMKATAQRVVAIGTGLGGLIAWCAVAGGAGIDDLVLWAAPGRGRSLVRELRAFSRLEDDPGPPDRNAAPEDSGLTSGGFHMSNDTLEALERLDLADLELPGAEHRRVLLLGRDGIGVDRRLRELVERTGADVAEATGEGYGAMMAKPQVAQAPRATFAAVATWLEQTGLGATALPALSQRAVAERPHADLVVDGVPIRERPLFVEQPFGRLAGILSEPVGPAQAPLCAVLLNAGAQRRIGPNRMWVEIARRWAARGVATLRLDVAGIGDSDGETICSTDDGVLYAPHFVEQVEAALDTLSADGPPRRFLLLGLCSGAYWSFHAALRDERVASVVLLNPRALVWDARLELARDARKLQKLRRAHIWRKILRRDTSLTSPFKIARAVLKRPFVARRTDDDAAALATMLDHLRERGVDVTLAFSGSEPLQQELERDGLLTQRERWPNLSLEQLATGPETHTLRPPRLQRRAHAVADAALERTLERAAPPTTAQHA